MAKPDIQKLRAEAVAKKDRAQAKARVVKAEAIERKILKASPVPQYVEMPTLTGDAQTDSAAELTAVEEGFRKRASDESSRFALATDSEYWACLCFQTREQKNAFFAALNILDLGNGARYFDGVAVAKRMGIELPSADVPYKTSSKVDPTWIEFVK